MKNKHCNDCGELVEFDGRECADYNIDINDDIICGECGIKSHCFCDECDEYVPTSECSMDCNGIVSCGECEVINEQ